MSCSFYVAIAQILHLCFCLCAKFSNYVYPEVGNMQSLAFCKGTVSLDYINRQLLTPFLQLSPVEGIPSQAVMHHASHMCVEKEYVVEHQ